MWALIYFQFFQSIFPCLLLCFVDFSFRVSVEREEEWILEGNVLELLIVLEYYNTLFSNYTT